MRYNTIAKTAPLALPAELQALIHFFVGIDANHPPDVCATSPKIWGHRFEPFALPAELQAHFYELFEGEPRGSRMRYNTIAKTAPLALPAELQAQITEVLYRLARHLSTPAFKKLRFQAAAAAPADPRSHSHTAHPLFHASRRSTSGCPRYARPACRTTDCRPPSACSPGIPRR